MTNRKAIKAAMRRLRAEAELRGVRDVHGHVKHEGSPLPESVANELDRAYDLGRIAGLREAATWLIDFDDQEKLRKHANALAKKARAK